MHPPREAAAFRPSTPWLVAAALPPILVSWWLLVRDQVAAGTAGVESLPVTPAAIASISVATRVAAWGAEAAAYALVWAAVGARLSWWRYALALVPLSALDLCADALRLHAAAFGESARLPNAIIGGLGALGPFDPEWQALAVAFAATGALTFVRIGGAALVQARLARVPWSAAFALTCGLWLAHHVAIWWALELTAGRSLPGGVAP